MWCYTQMFHRTALHSMVSFNNTACLEMPPPSHCRIHARNLANALHVQPLKKELMLALRAKQAPLHSALTSMNENVSVFSMNGQCTEAFFGAAGCSACYERHGKLRSLQ